MKAMPLAAVLALTIGAGAAQAAVDVIGDGAGRECYVFARDGVYNRQAIEICDSALAGEGLSRRDRAATLVNRGVLRLRRLEHELALADFEAAIAAQPRIAEAHVDRGAALTMLGRHADAVASIDHGLQLGPTLPQNAHFIRAVARERAGDVKGAYQDFRRAAELAPNWARPQRELRRFSVRPAG
jgi:tetratricopeptide (TPR) repeat protein